MLLAPRQKSERLSQHTDLTVLGDKAYISAPIAAELWCDNRIRPLTMPRRNQKTHLPAALQHQFNAIRQMIEPVNSQLTEQFNIETNYAPTFCGLCTRLYSKFSAHTLCIYLNRILENPGLRQIKSLAIPSSTRPA